ncbi:MAG TPA: hypothetical protein VLL05_13685 [Terriglobales bacterium]|nr:hypothetical protein [Terriglobales bacterium]
MKSLTILLVFAFAVSAYAAAPPVTEVVVLCALHQLHEQAAYYTYSDLSSAIEPLHPDVLAVELTPKDLHDRVEQKNKREYQNSVFPLLKRHNWVVIALEPEDPLRSKLIGQMREAEQSLQQTSPQKDDAFGSYVETVFQYLLSEWHGPADVNSFWTDRVLEVKHKFQVEIYGSKEREGWEGWNQYFLAQIVAAAQQNPGKRIVVIVGVEHGYWLRAHLREQGNIKLLDTEVLLR